jgi:ferric-dicitrate binding protein FerR (iron transport regulator)
MGMLAAAAVVCLGQFHSSHAAKHAAKAETVLGQVSVLRDSVPWAISAGELVQPREMILSGADGYAVFIVSDGSRFEVYPNSKVVFRQNAGNWRDLLDVLVGRIRVQIQHLGPTPNPNRVLTPSAVISVRGTTFDIEVDEEQTTLVEVEEGEVEVRHALLPTNTPKTVRTGESLRVYKDAPLARGKIDKGTILRQVFRAAMDAVITAGTRTPGGPGGAAGGGGGPVGDTGKTTAPPPPPTNLPPLD